jgi:branched-chain amino acid transport system ATP-binding protein
MLELHNLAMSFGGVQALKGISFDVREGLVVGLIGPNGAGKSTLINCITGITQPTRGEVYWGGVHITPLPPERVAALGISRIFQHARLFTGLTVLENVMIGAHRLGKSTVFGAMWRSPATRRDNIVLRDLSLEALAAVHVGHLAGAVVDELTAGQQRLVAVARALVSRPKLLLLDEPAAGLNNAERALLLTDLKAYFEQNETTALIVEHNLAFVMSLVSHIIVFDQGRLLTQGSPAAIRSDPAVIGAYLGNAHA